MAILGASLIIQTESLYLARVRDKSFLFRPASEPSPAETLGDVEMKYIQPLSWPPEWSGTGRHRGFLLGVPFVGKQEDVFRHIANQLIERTPDCLELWGSPGRRRTLAAVCAQAIKTGLGWPNALFIPEDPVEILLWDKTAYIVDHLIVPEILEKMERAAGVPRQSDEWWESLSEHTFGSVIDRLIGAAPVKPL